MPPEAVACYYTHTHTHTCVHTHMYRALIVFYIIVISALALKIMTAHSSFCFNYNCATCYTDRYYIVPQKINGSLINLQVINGEGCHELLRKLLLVPCILCMYGLGS